MLSGTSHFTVAVILFAINLIILILVLIRLQKISEVDIFLSRIKDPQKLEKLLSQNLEMMKQIRNYQEEIKLISDKMFNILPNCLQKFSIIRFNALPDVGGNQSFSLALLDAKNNGVIISGIHLREEMRVYGKPIKEGKSNYNLSEEEKKVLAQAMFKKKQM